MKSVPVILILIVSFFSNSVFATTYVFTGQGDWSNPANWQGNIIAPGDLKKGDTIIINGNAITTANCCTNDFGSNSGTVIISKGGSLTLQNATQFSNFEGGVFIVSGTLVNKTHFQVFKTSSITVSGTLTNELWIGNQGTLTLNGGTITNNAKLDNDMKVTAGQIIANCGSRIVNGTSGNFLVGSSILNCGIQIQNTGIVSGTAITKP